jgi:hypothetical protein
MSNNIIKYIHIGCPKSLSTSLQRGYFSQNKQILHLGVGLHDDNIGYLDDKINIYIELYIRYAVNYFYDKKKDEIKNYFQEKFLYAKRNKYTLTGISCELLSCRWSPSDVDTVEKAKRLHYTFGSDTKIIIIIRNQISLLKSLYGEFIKMGYPGSYNDFLEYAYKFQDRSFLSDFCYDYIYSIYKELFGKENILLIPLESYRDRYTKDLLQEDNKILILNRISEFLGIEKAEYSNFGHFNKSLDKNILAIKKELNNNHKHDYGNSVLGTVENQRLIKYFEKDLKISAPKEVLNDVLLKRKLLKKAFNESEQNPNLAIDYSCDSELKSRIYNFYAKSNKKLDDLLNLNLQDLGYPL